MMKKVFIAFASILSLAFVSCSDLTSSGGGSGSFFDKWWKLSEVYDEENGWYDATGGDDVVTEFTSTGIIYAYENGVTVSEQGEYEYYESTAGFSLFNSNLYGVGIVSAPYSPAAAHI